MRRCCSDSDSARALDGHLAANSFLPNWSPSWAADWRQDQLADQGRASLNRVASGFHVIRLVKPDYSLAEFPKLKAAADAVSRPQFREVYFLK